MTWLHKRVFQGPIIPWIMNAFQRIDHPTAKSSEKGEIQQTISMIYVSFYIETIR
jgi:hypothetical protein